VRCQTQRGTEVDFPALHRKQHSIAFPKHSSRVKPPHFTSTMAVWEGKKYKMEKSEGFDDYMKALGVGMNTTIKFKLGEEFDEETVDVRMVKSVCTFDGNKLIHEQKGEKPTTIVREFTATDLTATMTAGNAKCVRYYKAV
uniref:Cytosolic fatty-acid binding proteins domain-containing protein n=1 Tax=Anopheles coluzzii TaxID=1518534 RepID=A0A8W7PAR2_ANOCL